MSLFSLKKRVETLAQHRRFKRLPKVCLTVNFMGAGKRVFRTGEPTRYYNAEGREISAEELHQACARFQ